MTDLELCEQVATIWVENGGDYEGFLFYQDRIKDAILNLTPPNDWEDELEDDYAIPEDWDEW
jgi:hypothetical protein